MNIHKHPKHSFLSFLKRTVAAQMHLVGCVAAIIGVFVLLHYASQKPAAIHFWACLVFGVTSILVFATSSIYHFMSDGFRIPPALHARLKKLDHFAIYFFIAGTYTVILINAVSAPWSNILLALVWTVALLGVLYTHFKPRLPLWARHRFVYTGLFLVMGWLIVFRIGEVVHNLSSGAMLLLLLGGISYSLGAVVYATRRPRLLENIFGFHEVWHLAVLLGFAFHYFVVLSFYRG